MEKRPPLEWMMAPYGHGRHQDPIENGSGRYEWCQEWALVKAVEAESARTRPQSVWSAPRFDHGAILGRGKVP